MRGMSCSLSSGVCDKSQASRMQSRPCWGRVGVLAESRWKFRLDEAHLNASRMVGSHDGPFPGAGATSRLRGQVGSGLLGGHVGGVPGGPVLVLVRAVQEAPAVLLALTVGGLGTPQRALQVRGGDVACLGRVHPAGAPSRYLLHQ